MKGNRGTETSLEVAVRSQLHRLGYRFRKNMRIRTGSAGVRPDIVFVRERIAVFLDGCFWHSCAEHGNSPGTNKVYWDAKLRSNRARDRVVTAELQERGWYVLRIWEHEPIEMIVRHVREAVARRRHAPI
jgi:DNA mismatch endonuclease (patch repair protein)